jgi:hypothetical protein
MAISKAKQRLLDNGLCLSGDGNVIKSRGLCNRCLKWAHGQIDSGKLSEEALVKDGHMLPAKRQGRRAANGLAEALRKEK